MNKKKIIGIAAIVVFAIVSVFSGMMFYWQTQDHKQSAEDFNALAELITEETPTPEQTPIPVDEPEAEPDERELAYAKYKVLYEQNNDFVGWISIDGTNVNYPVMQSIDTPDFYLKRNFEKAYSDFGVPYVDEACAVDLSTNTVIYGHHMKNGTMFSSLVKYVSKSYFEEHPIIRFDTFGGFGEYQVIAAFSFDTNNEDFRYNEYTDMTEAEFDEFISECMERRAYDTGFTAEYGDRLLTLSTCEYTHQNGRFVVVAKLITD
ncbi:MAG: class B sortase [Lachnospiraceae bacterium]|jgi:sortase B